MDSVDSALRFLQRQFASVADEETKWKKERTSLENRVKELEEEREAQETAYKDALMRIKMLEFALKQERGRYLNSSAPVTSVVHTNLHLKKSTSNTLSDSGRTNSITISRPIEKATSSESPAQSPSSQKSHEIFRLDSNTSSKSTSSKDGMEITRPRILSRAASGQDQTVERTVETTKPASIPLAPKSAFKPHKLKLKLSSHMDGIRSLAFHPTEPLLISGSEDSTAKVWNLNALASGPPPSRAVEMDAFMTVRCHTDSVLAVAAIGSENYPNNAPNRVGAFATAGRDGSICLIDFPSGERETSEPLTYEEYQGMKSHVIKRAHEDAVWDLHTHPLSNLLFSAGADGVVRSWGITTELSLKSELRCTSRSLPSGAASSKVPFIPTSVHTLPSDTKTCAVGYTCGSIAQFDFHGEQLVQLLRSTESDFSSRDSRDGQVNQIVAHPTLPLVFAAHQDKKIRVYDLRAGDCVGSFAAHQDSVSSLSIDSSGLNLASVGHDGSLRVWSVSERHCIFEQQAHRHKMAESVHSVAYHPSRNFIATGGADSLIKVYQ